MSITTSSNRSAFTTSVERAALALAEEHKVAALRSTTTPINKMDSSFSAIDVALFLLSLPRELPFRKLIVSVELPDINITEKLIAKWCLLRQELEEEEEKENAPPSLSTPTSASSVSLSPQVLPSAPLTKYTIPGSPNTDSRSSIKHATLSPSIPALSAPEPASSGHQEIATLLPTSFEDSSIGKSNAVPSVTLSENLAVAPGKAVEEADCPSTCSAPDHDLPGNLPTEDEDDKTAYTTSSPSLLSRSPLSSPQRCSSSVQDPLLPKPRTRLVRSNGVPDFSALRTKTTSQDKTASTEADFFDTPSVKACAFNPLPLTTPPFVVNFDHDDLASPSRTAGTSSRELLREPSVEAEAHAPRSPIDRNNGGPKRKRGREEEEEEEGDGEDRPRHSLQTGSSSVGQQSVVSPAEGGRKRKRATGDDGRDERQDRPPQQARLHDGFFANLVHNRFIPQYFQYMW